VPKKKCIERAKAHKKALEIAKAKDEFILGVLAAACKFRNIYERKGEIPKRFLDRNAIILSGNFSPCFLHVYFSSTDVCHNMSTLDCPGTFLVFFLFFFLTNVFCCITLNNHANKIFWPTAPRVANQEKGIQQPEGIC
jgi:hypothetical protein